MDKRLRITLLATALLIVPGVGDLLAAHQLHAGGHESPIVLLLFMASVFLIPTSIILSAAVLHAVRAHWREQLPLAGLAAFNLATAITVVVLFVRL